MTPTIVKQVVQHRGARVETSVGDGHFQLDSSQDRVSVNSSRQGWVGLVVPGL
ncbi:hypothetical protein [Mycobacterium avium]|uniref:hypothetical protein n=1 Tax=Mycobacterium avium TaxID=1764 RepID=UPI0012DAD719|nr:hypothetical protein [Mycobacterium avium]